MSENSNVVTVGWASRWGFALTGVGIILPFLAELADVTEHLGVDPDLYTKAGFIIGGITILGRMLQQIGQGAIAQNSVAGFSHLLRQRLQRRAARA